MDVYASYVIQQNVIKQQQNDTATSAASPNSSASNFFAGVPPSNSSPIVPSTKFVAMPLLQQIGKVKFRINAKMNKF